MKKHTLLPLFFLIAQVCLGQWVNLNSGIDDTLTDIVFFDDQGVVSGENGLYFTLNGGIGSANWQRFEITDNALNAELYANTRFNSSFSNPNNNGTGFTVYSVGEDIVNNKAVIMSLELPSLTYDIITLDFSNSSLNDIEYCKNFGRYYAVGNNGLMLYFSNDISDHSVVTNNWEIDFTSISFNTTGYMARIGSQDKYIRMATSGHQLTTVETPGETHNDMTYGTYSVNDKYMRHNYTTKYVYTNYDYGPINGNAIFDYGSRNFVGTDHGIFMSNTARNVLQWQPSSGSIGINAFWSEFGSATLYACGSNGAILKSEAPTVEAKPYVRIDFDGGCISTNSFNINGTTGDTSSCLWYIDDVLVNSNCGTFNHSFDNVGVYSIKLVVDYNGLTTESTKTVHIVNDPEIDKPITILDAILCHEEPIQIEVGSSEPGVIYTLHKEGTNATYGSSDIGNGGTISFTSSPLSETANYYLKSANIYAPSCTRTFTDTFEITVEQTEANFHVGLINASIDEDVPFYQTSTEANSFNWSFTSAANNISSSEEHPTNSFNSPGIHNVMLSASSANSCVDNITADSPNIYIEPTDNTACWTYLNQSENPNWNGGYTPDISHITKVTDGYLTGGYYRNEIFGTNHGIEFMANESQGGYLTRHDSKGTLKWIVYTTIASSSSRSSVTASVEDQNGDVYLAISNNSGFVFHDNSGKTKALSNQDGGSIVKLDSNGELIWYMTIRTYVATGLTIDEDNNLIIYGEYDIYNDSQHNVHLNDQLIGEVGAIVFPGSGGYRFCNGIIKATPDGNILWDNEIFSTAGTFGTRYQTRDIGIDANNNYYVQGIYKNEIYIYHTGATDPTYLDFHQYDAGGSIYSHLFKLDSDGALQWLTRSYATQNNDYESIWDNNSKTDANGNTYLTGYSNFYGADFSHFHNVENADGSVFSSDEAPTYFVKKINVNGICEWIVGVEEESTTLTYPKGFHIELKNDRINVMGSLKANVNTPENLIFKSTDNENIIAPLTSNDLFFGAYTSEGLIDRVSVFNSVITEPYDLGYTGLLMNDLGNYYVSSNYGPASEENGRIDFLNSDVCGIVYNSTLSIDEFENQIKVHAVPNPSTGDFKLSIDKPYLNCKIEIYNTLGQLVSKREFIDNSDIPLNIKGKSGLYFIKVNIDEELEKIIKILIQ